MIFHFVKFLSLMPTKIIRISIKKKLRIPCYQAASAKIKKTHSQNYCKIFKQFSLIVAIKKHILKHYVFFWNLLSKKMYFEKCTHFFYIFPHLKQLFFTAVRGRIILLAIFVRCNYIEVYKNFKFFLYFKNFKVLINLACVFVNYILNFFIE